MHDRNFLYVFDNYFFAIYTAKALVAAIVNVFQYDSSIRAGEWFVYYIIS